MPNGRCRFHGGKTPSGYKLPQTKTGRYSRYLPTRLSAQYEASQNDDQLLGLREEVALVDTRLTDLLQRVDSGESGEAWKNAAKALHEFRQALASNDTIKRAVTFAALESVIMQANDDYAAWGEIHKLIDQRRRLAESERRHAEQMGQLITVNQFMLLLGNLTALLRENIEDRDTLARISNGLNRLITIDSDRV